MKSLVLVLIAGLAVATSARAVTIDYPDSPEPVTAPITTTIADPVTLSITSGSAIQSGIISGDGSLTKIGAGRITLAELSGVETHTYAGPTTVVAGTLIVDSVIVSDVTVQSGATFGGDGFVNGDITLESGSTLVTVDCFDANTLVWNPGATLVFSLSDGFSDILELTGSLSKGGAGTGGYAFHFLDSGWQSGQSYTLIVFDDAAGTDFLASDFSYSNIGDFGGEFAIVDNAVQFTYTAVPEPATSALGIVALLGAFIVLRRRYRMQAEKLCEKHSAWSRPSGRTVHWM